MRLGGHDDGSLFYPALAVPVGEDDELVCPVPHLDAARRWLVEGDGLNILVIGYSGIDKEVLRLLAESGNAIRRLLVVNGSEPYASEAADRIAAALGASVQDEWVRTYGFSDFVRQGELRRWFGDLR